MVSGCEIFYAGPEPAEIGLIGGTFRWCLVIMCQSFVRARHLSGGLTVHPNWEAEGRVYGPL